MASITDLTINEINIISRKVGEDALKAIHEGTEARWEAMALAQWMLAKRQDPHAPLERYMALTVAEMTELIDAGEVETAEAPAEDAEGPTAPAS